MRLEQVLEDALAARVTRGVDGLDLDLGAHAEERVDAGQQLALGGGRERPLTAHPDHIRQQVRAVAHECFLVGGEQLVEAAQIAHSLSSSARSRTRAHPNADRRVPRARCRAVRCAGRRRAGAMAGAAPQRNPHRKYARRGMRVKEFCAGARSYHREEATCESAVGPRLDRLIVSLIRRLDRLRVDGDRRGRL